MLLHAAFLKSLLMLIVLFADVALLFPWNPCGCLPTTNNDKHSNIITTATTTNNNNNNDMNKSNYCRILAFFCLRLGAAVPQNCLHFSLWAWWGEIDYTIIVYITDIKDASWVVLYCTVICCYCHLCWVVPNSVCLWSIYSPSEACVLQPCAGAMLVFSVFLQV